MDNQIVKINQSFKKYLKHYMNNLQSKLISILAMAKLALNIKILDITRVIQFFANF